MKGSPHGVVQWWPVAEHEAILELRKRASAPRDRSVQRAYSGPTEQTLRDVFDGRRRGMERRQQGLAATARAAAAEAAALAGGSA